MFNICSRNSITMRNGSSSHLISYLKLAATTSYTLIPQISNRRFLSVKSSLLIGLPSRRAFSIVFRRANSFQRQQKTISSNCHNCWRCHCGGYNSYSTSAKGSQAEGDDSTGFCINTSEFPPEKIRNFSIIAHIDHGKSTLADRLLELTGTISKSADNKQILDKLQVERERGITVKAQTASMVYQAKDGERYLLNLIDTPGHVDFSYEVSRSLSACDGVVLIVDANQGVQAQTVANFYLAFSKNLVIIPVLNKIDLKHARPDVVTEQLHGLFEIPSESVLRISAKMGIGIDDVLEAVVSRIPHPTGNRDLVTRALIFDSWYDRYKGVALLVAVVDGHLRLSQNITIAQSGKSYETKEIGVLHPDPTPLRTLYAGQVGYLYCNMRSIKEASVGGTIHPTNATVEILAGFKKAKPMVYAGVYPMDQSEHPMLRSALEKLLLNDSSVESKVESSAALGHGWRLGFLGVLHMDVFNQRLEQEYGAQVVLTAPNVPVKAKIFGAKNIKAYGGEIVTVNNPANLPDPVMIEEMSEPFVIGTIITPDVFLGEIMSLCMDRRGVQRDSRNIDSERIMMTFKLPLNEIVVDFYDKLKSITSGYASFDYEELGYEPSNLTIMDILLNGDLIPEMTSIVHVTKAKERGKAICARLKETIPRHQFQIAIQAAVGSRIIAREDIKALRKDVAAKLYGGDRTRRDKLLKRQSEGKKRMKMIGRIEMPRETFIKVLER
ncbi:unnamed protein product [Orchesella dallaii]|uniref:Translation factor GUF1 homolog, mitochondrial n=1 Tax=Orchesella dallaii TaxID=48710 RepID=A0ABP1PQ28_9HEXA